MIDIRLSENMKLMKSLESNSVDLIYCDILYGTGRKFKDYQDLKPKREVIEEHYIPRIKEMHRLLKDTGSIYLQTNVKTSHWIRYILDDVFGYDNFCNEIIWEFNKGGFSNTNKKYNNEYDVILYYANPKHKKTDLRMGFDSLSGKTKKDFRYSDENGVYKLINANIQNRNINKTDLTKYVKQKEQYFLKKYKHEHQGLRVCDLWLDIKHINWQSKEKNNYQSQKPKALLERIIKASSNEGDLVADFYGGSFTTAEVCKDLNRNFIGCDISEKGVNIGLKRCGLNCY